jgi:hypothetical protein
MLRIETVSDIRSIGATMREGLSLSPAPGVRSADALNRNAAE